MLEANADLLLEEKNRKTEIHSKSLLTYFFKLRKPTGSVLLSSLLFFGFFVFCFFFLSLIFLPLFFGCFVVLHFLWLILIADPQSEIKKKENGQTTLKAQKKTALRYFKD